MVLVSCVLIAHAAGHEPTVQLASGAQLQGISQSAVHQFLGIPYANPPVGSRRFVRPTEYTLPAGPFDATAFGAACIQFSSSLQSKNPSEDCLFLNVFVPTSSSTNSTALSTLFFIHGGTEVSGDSSEYDGSALASEYGVIVVTVNYRLGPLGFLESTLLLESEPQNSNLGIKDQVLALQWVAHNIGAFNGDPQRVTVQGESAGAVNTMHHVTSPLSKGLFSAAIVESLPLEELHRAADSAMIGHLYTEGLGCQTLECLQRVNISTLLNASLPYGSGMRGPRGPLFGKFGWGPVWGHADMPKPYALMAADGSVNVKQIIIGSNTHEGNLFTLLDQTTNGKNFEPTAVVTPIGYSEANAKWVWSSLVGEAQATQISDFYQNFSSLIPGRTSSLLAQSYGEFRYTCAADYIARAISKGSPSTSIFMYRFGASAFSAYGCLSKSLDALVLGACHSAELAFVFNNATIGVHALCPKFTESEQQLATNMSHLWANMAASGNPNGEGLPEWPTWQPAQPRHLYMDTAASMVINDIGEWPSNPSNLHSACPFWEALLGAEVWGNNTKSKI